MRRRCPNNSIFFFIILFFYLSVLWSPSCSFSAQRMSCGWLSLHEYLTPPQITQSIAILRGRAVFSELGTTQGWVWERSNTQARLWLCSRVWFSEGDGLWCGELFIISLSRQVFSNVFFLCFYLLMTDLCYSGVGISGSSGLPVLCFRLDLRYFCVNIIFFFTFYFLLWQLCTFRYEGETFSRPFFFIFFMLNLNCSVLKKRKTRQKKILPPKVSGKKREGNRFNR